MSCRLESRITAILLLAATLPLCLTTHGLVFDQNQSVQVGMDLTEGSKARGKDTETKRSKRTIFPATPVPSSNIYMLTPAPSNTDAKRLFQSDFPGFPDPVVDGKVHFSSSYIPPEWLQMRPLVQCSSAAMILKVKGLSSIHLLVNREGASPVPILNLPLNCGYNLKVTWRDVILIVSYDGCYVLQRNGSYVLHLLWWGIPLTISCPMPSAPESPSGFCSYLGITLKIKGSPKEIEKYSIKVNERWEPLVTTTCACRMDSSPEDLILFIPFTAKCVQDGSTTLNLFLDGKMYTVSCPPHHYVSYYPQYNPPAPFSQTLHPPETPYIPLNFSVTKPEMPKPHLPAEQASPVSGTGVIIQHPHHKYVSYDTSHVPVAQSNSEIPTTGGTEINSPPFQPSSEHLQVPTEFYDHVVSTTRVSPQPQVPQLPQVTWVPQQHMFPVLTNDSTPLSPVLTCIDDLLRVHLPSAKIKSVKIKDVKKRVWVPVSSAPVHCGYLLQRKGSGVVFSSPLPGCHSYFAPPSLLSISLKFWDPVRQRHHAVRLQCPYTSPSPTMMVLSATTSSLMLTPQPAGHEIQPSRPEKPLDSNSKPSNSGDPSIPFPNPSDQMTPPTFQQSNDTMPSFWPTKPTRMSQTPLLPSQVHQPQVLCLFKDMSVTLPLGPVMDLMVQSPIIGNKESVKEVLLHDSPINCGYIMKKNQNGGINILLPYTSCHMVYQAGLYRIVLKYRTADGQRVEALLSCQVPTNHECSLPFEHRFACGPSSVSAADCRDLGCCHSVDTQTCYYPMDECTADRHFVFSIPASLTQPPLSPALLVAAGNSSCTPQRVVDDLALFKIPLDGCGTHKYEVGNTMIYMLEILNTLHSVTLNYGTITRDLPFRLLVECRYLPGTVASMGYLVKSPSLGPSIQAQGVFGVQLRIAKDKQYSSYYPQYHRPLRKLLGKPLYLEVRLLNPLDPSAVLLVHYCVAYPRSAYSAWVLVYDGCPNPLDVTPSHEPPPTPSDGLANHVRRFTISTFQFLEKNREDAGFEEQMVEKDGEEEEIYFMCATEVCLPSEGPCVEGCIDRAVDSPAVKS